MTRSEKVIWLFFAATSIQLAFLQPYVILVPGDPTNLFSGLLCFLTLVVALIFAGRGMVKLRSPAFLISAALLVLGVLSSLCSSTPLSSSFRTFVVLASGLGGFWCARLLLNTPENQRRFLWFSLCLLSVVVIFSLAGFFLSGEIQYFFNNSHTHPLTNVILLLSFAPLTLLSREYQRLRWLSLVLLGLSYVVLCLSQRLSVVFIPVGLGILAVLLGTLRWKHLVAALLVIGLLIGLASHQILWFKLSKQYPYYRIENIFFSWDIAKQHPLLGIGLKTPRVSYLKDYQAKYPYTDKEQFSKDIADIISADNIFLTLMVGVGFPFLICYLIALSILLFRLMRVTLKPPSNLTFPPLALLFPILAALLHYQLYDGLLFAQNWWFFHILLGLIPFGDGEKEKIVLAIAGKSSLVEISPSL
jgi:hypothetical protein